MRNLLLIGLLLLSCSAAATTQSRMSHAWNLAANVRIAETNRDYWLSCANVNIKLANEAYLRRDEEEVWRRIKMASHCMKYACRWQVKHKKAEKRLERWNAHYRKEEEAQCQSVSL